MIPAKTTAGVGTKYRVQWSAGGSGNAMALTGPSAGLTFFSLSENSAGAVQFRMDQELGG